MSGAFAMAWISTLMDINRSAPAIATHEVIIQAPLDRIWNLLKNVDRWPDWNLAVKKAKLDGAFEPGGTFRWKSRGVAIVSTLQEVEPMHRIVWTGKAIGTQAIHVWTLSLTIKGVKVTTSESFDGWLVKLMRKSMQATLDHALIDWLYELKRRAEKG